MKKIKIILAALMIFSICSAQDIPVMDKFANATLKENLAKTVKEYGEQAKRWTDTINHYKKEYEALKSQLSAISEIRNIDDILGAVNGLNGFELPSVSGILSGQGVSGDQRQLLNDSGVTANCKESSHVATCEAKAVNALTTLKNNDEVLKSLEKHTTELNKLANRMKGSKDVKESQDIANAMQQRIAVLDMEKIKLELFKQQQTSNEKLIEEKQKKDFYEVDKKAYKFK